MLIKTFITKANQLFYSVPFYMGLMKTFRAIQTLVNIMYLILGHLGLGGRDWISAFSGRYGCCSARVTVRSRPGRSTW